MPIDVPAMLSLALPGLGILAVVTARGDTAGMELGSSSAPATAALQVGDTSATAPTGGRRHKQRDKRRGKRRGKQHRTSTESAAVVTVDHDDTTAAPDPAADPAADLAADLAADVLTSIDSHTESSPNAGVGAGVEAGVGSAQGEGALSPAEAELRDQARLTSTSALTPPPAGSRYARGDRIEVPHDGDEDLDRRPAFTPVPAGSSRPVSVEARPAGVPVARAQLVHVPDDLSALEASETAEPAERMPDALGSVRAVWTDGGVLGGDLGAACRALEAAWRSGDADAVAAVAAHERSLAWVAWVTAACVEPNPSRPRYVGLAWRTLREAAAAASIDVDTTAGRDLLAKSGYAGLLPAPAENLFSALRVIVDVAGTPIRVDMPASATALAYAQASVAAANGDLLSLDDLLATLPSHPLGSLLEAVADEFDQDRYVVGAMRQDAWGLVFAHLGLLRIAKTNPHDGASIASAADRVRELLLLLGPESAADDDPAGGRALEAASGTLVISEADGSRLRVRVRDLVTDGVYWQAWAAARRDEPHLARVLLSRIPDAPGAAALLSTLD